MKTKEWIEGEQAYHAKLKQNKYRAGRNIPLLEQEQARQWYERIRMAKDGELSDVGFRKMKIDASNWTTCACGSQDGRIERDADGSPTDPQLNRDGVWFYEYIDKQSWTGAVAKLNHIEKRAGELISKYEYNEKRRIARKKAKKK